MVAGPAPLRTALAFLLSLASPAQSDVWMVELARLSATADELHPTAAPAVLRGRARARRDVRACGLSTGFLPFLVTLVFSIVFAAPVFHNRILYVLAGPVHVQVGLTVELRPYEFRIQHQCRACGTRRAGIEYVPGGTVPYPGRERTIVSVHQQERNLVEVRPYEPRARKTRGIETGSLRDDHALQHGQAGTGRTALARGIVLFQISDRMQQRGCRLRVARQDRSAEAFDQVSQGTRSPRIDRRDRRRHAGGTR